MTRDRPFLGILMMLGFCVLAPATDALAKALTAFFPVVQLIVVRFVFQTILLAPITKQSEYGKLRDFKLTGLIIWRTLLHIFGIGMMFTALIYLPLAEAIAIAFVMPFIMLLLGRTFLNETVGFRRLTACVVGFVGTLMVVQPTFANVGWPALLPLGVAFIFALFMLTTRQVAKQIDPVALQTVSGMMASVVLVPILMAAAAFGVEFAQIPALTSGLMVALFFLGLLGTAAHLLMTWSLRFAPSATLAPMQYLEIPIATLVGWLVFRDLPNGLASAGIAVTILAGLYIIYREGRESAAVSPGESSPTT
ncbi:MAG: DMT family transporter [Pseudomonadota bacterium]